MCSRCHPHAQTVHQVLIVAAAHQSTSAGLKRSKGIRQLTARSFITPDTSGHTCHFASVTVCHYYSSVASSASGVFVVTECVQRIGAVDIHKQQQPSV
jgi:hypothetical protein